MKTFINLVTDRQPGEHCIILGSEHYPLRITCEDGEEIACVNAPAGGWTHYALLTRPELACDDPEKVYDAFLGSKWIGSTEI